MLDEELKRLWSSSTEQERVKLDKALLLQDVDTQLHRLEQGIKGRNMLEIGAALFLLPMFLISAIFIPFLLSKIGSVVIMLFCLLVIYQLRKVRKYKPVQTAIPIQDYLKQQRQYIYKEMQLLNNVGYWYIGPFLAGFILFFLGFSEMGVQALAIRIAGGLLLGVVIYILNKREVEKNLKPLLDKLDNTIAGLQA